MEKVDEIILHGKFMTLAEKCDTLEKMQKFCKAFLTKYPTEVKQKENTEYWPNRYEEEVRWLPKSKPHEYTASVSMADYGFSMSNEEHLAMIERAKHDIANSLTMQAINGGGVEWTSRKDYHSMSTIYSGTMSVNVGEKK